MAKKNWQYETYRCVFCNHKGEWITVYIRGENFTYAYEYLKQKIELWIIKEISCKLENGELSGKFIEGQDLKEPTILYQH